MGTGTCVKFMGASSLYVCLVFPVRSDSLLVPHPSLPCSQSHSAPGPALNALELLQAGSQPMGCSRDWNEALQATKKMLQIYLAFPFPVK